MHILAVGRQTYDRISDELAVTMISDAAAAIYLEYLDA